MSWPGLYGAGVPMVVVVVLVLLLRLPFLLSTMLVGVGLGGLRCGGASGLPSMSYCVVGSVANWSVREPSDQRSMRALDCSSLGLDGERRHRRVVMAVLKAEKVGDGSLLEWWSVTGGWKFSWCHSAGSMLRKRGTLRR